MPDRGRAPNDERGLALQHGRAIVFPGCGEPEGLGGWVRVPETGESRAKGEWDRRGRVERYVPRDLWNKVGQVRSGVCAYSLKK